MKHLTSGNIQQHHMRSVRNSETADVKVLQAALEHFLTASGQNVRLPTRDATRF